MQHLLVNGKAALDRTEGARYLSISVRFLDELASSGEIPRIKVGTKTLFRVNDLFAYLAKQVPANDNQAAAPARCTSPTQ